VIRDILAERLKYFREQVGLTIYEVGERLGKSGKTVSAWENGRGQPDADMLLMICDLYKINSIAELYGQSAEFPAPLSADEFRIVETFRKFNAEGKEKVLSYISDLDHTGKYKKEY